MPLKEYEHKRDFARTPEPRGKPKPSTTGRLFVVQKHRARQLHYDFRIELDGVLLSWAVPKGPSLQPSEKRLAVQVEDHPVDYGSFEGVIPEDEYGGGTVMLWDRGQWSPLTEPRLEVRSDSRADSLKAGREALRKGTLKFTLSGEKLRGAWTLVRMKDKGEGTKNWLLIKERDDEALSEDLFCVIDEEPFSAVSGRTIDEIAVDHDCVWTGKGAQGKVAVKKLGYRRGLYSRIDLNPGALRGAQKGKWPSKFPVPEPKAAAAIPPGDDWLHEIPDVGVGVVCRLQDKYVELQSTSGEDWTCALPEIAREVARLPAATGVLVGIATSADAKNVAAIEGTLAEGNARGLEYVVFDLPYCEGYDLRPAPLIERKALLRTLLERASGPLKFCDHIQGHGETVLSEAGRLGAHGIVSRRASSKYPARTCDDWIQIRLHSDENRSESKRVVGKRRNATASESVEISGVKLTHPDRILYPEQRVTKRMLAEYYEAIAEQVLPHVAGRPLSLVRCPRGIEKDTFFQKQLGEMPKDYLRDAPDKDDEPYVVLGDVKGLVTLAQWSVLEVHAWGCRKDDLDKPDRMIFDLDPGPDVAWEQIVEGAKGLKFLLLEFGLESFVKTSGGKGLHVVVPLVRRHRWDEVKDFAARVARRVVSCDPKHFTVLMGKPERRGKVYIDYLRNIRGSTCVAAYSTRARPGALVSTPLRWEEVDAQPIRRNIVEVPGPAISGDDPWAGFFQCKQGISPRAAKMLSGKN